MLILSPSIDFETLVQGIGRSTIAVLKAIVVVALVSDP